MRDLNFETGGGYRWELNDLTSGSSFSIGLKWYQGKKKRGSPPSDGYSHGPVNKTQVINLNLPLGSSSFAPHTSPEGSFILQLMTRLMQPYNMDRCLESI